MFVRCNIFLGCLLTLCVASRAAEQDGAVENASHQHLHRLETLLQAGRLQEFAEAAIASASSEPQPAGLPRLQVEAFLAMGRNHDAETLALRQLLAASHHSAAALDPGLLKLWLTARWRQARGPDDPSLDAWLNKQPDDAGSTVAALRFWREALTGRTPYRFHGAARSSVLPMRAQAPPEGKSAAARAPDDVAFEAIAMDVNGLHLPRVFVDTGAQHTLLTPAAAAAAGLEIGPPGAQMVGFSNFAARPAIVRTLRLGELVLNDVPVYVGESAALTQEGGQASLGIDLLYHLRCVLDYPRRQVVIEPAAREGSREPSVEQSTASWEIPLWTFSRTCLAQGQMPDGEYARTLIDTGNRHGTYLSSRWASRRLPDFQPLKNWFAQRYHLDRFTLGSWQLGNLQLANWPVRGTLPPELEQLNVVDLLIGHDLLARYRVEIDLLARRLRLREPEIGY